MYALEFSLSNETDRIPGPHGTYSAGREGHMDKKRAGTGGVSEMARQGRGRYHQREARLF